MIECKLHPSKRQTAFGGLCALGHLLAREGVLEPLSGVKIDQKTVVHSPAEKLTDALMGMLSGCKAIYETNVRVRPDGPLSRAFGRERVAEQSTIQRTLEAFTQENVITSSARGGGGDRGPLLWAAFPPLREGDAPLGGGPHGA